jgi:hypothetical protein
MTNLTDILANRRWIRCSDPFPHIVARDVFAADFYGELESAFRKALARGPGQPGEKDRFARNMRGYDAYEMVLSSTFSGPLEIFISRAWHDMLTGLVGFNSTRDVTCALHHHDAGSATGWVHTDLGLRWFTDAPRPDGINLACSGRTPDAAHKAGLKARPVVRAVAMLFYLNNEWSPGDGGETGLYRSIQDPPDQPVGVAPPVNNSILLFECSPYSFHSFLKNHRHPRNSVNLWLHRPKAEVVARWGESKIFDVARI